MQNLERSKFDESWKDAFDEAGVTPSDLVWAGIDQKLTQEEGEGIKRRLVFYQRLAAACILFAALTGVFGVYYWKENDRQLAKKDNSSQGVTTNAAANDDAKNQTESKAESTTKPERLSSDKTNDGVTAKKSNGESFYEATVLKKETADDQALNSVLAKESSSVLPSESKEFKKTRLASTDNLIAQDLPLLPLDSLKGEPTYVEIVRKLPALPAIYMHTKKEKTNHEQLWASVSAAAGEYMATNSGLSFAATPAAAGAFSSRLPSSPTGKSFTYGVLGGVRMAPRWVVQTGVQYMNQSTGYMSNIPSSSLDALANLSTSSVQYSGATASPYDVTNTNEFLSVPIQVGYLLIDRKIGWQVNPGVASDFFIRNTLSDPSGARQSYSQGAGSDSPYRSVNFAGLLSSEVSYKLGKNYRLSLVPGARYSFNPVLKSQSAGNPFAWDVGFRFRYIIR
ncbi:hypothetical protein WSM22_04410 [Cytophagales bacterium WSM2-2]|nr:hypothetical protein WSM22_04410 [Cytophagales bacterium WSM2-2]